MIISVALCTYNGEIYIEAQLQSIFSQTILPNEIIICDDGSTDNTISLVETWQKQKPNIHLYKNEQSLGVVKNFEKAINLCENGLVILSDQDDIWFPHKVETIINYFDENTDKKAVFHNLELYKDNKATSYTIWEYLDFGTKQQSQNNSELLIYTAVIDNVLTGAASAFIKEEPMIFSKEIPFMLHDFQLLLYFANKNQLGTLSKTLGYYRIHDKQQVGAKIEKDPNILASKAKYENNNLQVKLDRISFILNRYLEYADKTPLLYPSIELLQKELQTCKKNFLKNYTFVTRKRILISWYRKNRYHTSSLEIFLL